MSESHGTKAIIAAFFANLGIALAKLVGFLLTGAASMLAEAVHSAADSTNQGLLLLGGRRSRRVADEAHPFGFGRERFFWSFVVALVLFSGGGLFALVEGIEKLRHPHELESPAVAVGILAVAILMEAFSLRTAVVESRHLKGDRSWWRFIKESKNPELPTVLLEDTGALVGLVLALAGVGIAHLTGEARWDAAGSIGIGILLVMIAVVLAVEMKSLLIGEAATPEDLKRIRSALEGEPGIEGVIHLRTEHLGPDDLLVVAKVAVAGDAELIAVTTAIDRAEAAIRSAVPSAKLIFLEPDLLRTT